jgi:hypothetical protein
MLLAGTRCQRLVQEVELVPMLPWRLVLWLHWQVRQQALARWLCLLALHLEGGFADLPSRSWIITFFTLRYA